VKLPNLRDLHTLLEDLRNLLPRVYRLAERAPEAVIGAVAIVVMIFLVTAAPQFSSWREAQFICFGIGALFGLVGAFGFMVAILRARPAPPSPSNQTPDDSPARSLQKKRPKRGA